MHSGTVQYASDHQPVKKLST